MKGNGHRNDFSNWANAAELVNGQTLTLPPGVHHAWPDSLPARFLHISNNDDGEKRILFDLSSKEDITIEGNGAELVMHGHMIPFFMKGAKNITIRNLTIDWANPFYAQGEVTATGEGWFECRFEEAYTVEVREGELLAINPDIAEPIHFHNINFIDPVRGEQAYGSTDEYGALKKGNYFAEAKPGNIIRFESGHLRNRPQAGQVVVFQYDGRTSPAIAVQNSDTVRIENVTQYHAAGIANIFEGSRDIYIDRMTMTRREGRWYSALNDATHYVDCSGDIQITNSLFEFQGDDATNIHGIYRPIEAFLPDNGMRLKLMHYQQIGVDTIKPGSVLAIYRKDDLQSMHTAKVKDIKWVNPALLEVYMEEGMPPLEAADHVVMNYLTDVRVDISGNRIQNNRARGLLIKTLGVVRIHDNVFHTPGPALMIRIDASSWYEAGPVDNVEVVNNRFEQCNFGGWGRALFEIGPKLEDSSSTLPVMRNIRIHDNTIIRIAQPLIMANHVEGLEFHDNMIVRGKDYPFDKRFESDYQFGPGVTTGKWQSGE